VWDERFTFEIETGQEDLQVFVVNKDVYATNEAVGKVDISLNFLRDQMKHDEWFELEPLKQMSDNGSIGAVHLVLQWIYCREKYFEQALIRVEETH
jgi:hypothetical protein